MATPSQCCSTVEVGWLAVRPATDVYYISERCLRYLRSVNRSIRQALRFSFTCFNTVQYCVPACSASSARTAVLPMYCTV